MARTAEWSRLEHDDGHTASWDAAAPHRRYAMRQALSRYKLAWCRSRQRDALPPQGRHDDCGRLRKQSHRLAELQLDAAEARGII